MNKEFQNIIDRYPDAVELAIANKDMDAEDLMDLLLDKFTLSPPHAAQVIATYAKVDIVEIQLSNLSAKPRDNRFK